MPETQQVEQGTWSRERAELVRRTICPKGISEDEFALFMEQCKRSGLDPLLKEAFCVARRQNAGNRERPNWVTKYEFQPSETGMLARAERFPDFRGLQASAVFAEDEIIVDQGKGEVVHRFNPAKRKGALVGAWARLVRDGRLPVVVWLDFSGYVQQTPLWAKIPTTMIEKCARVAALRKAYPEAFGGLYVREEMPADEFPAAPEEAVPGPYEERGAKQDRAPTFPSLAPAPSRTPEAPTKTAVPPEASPAAPTPTPTPAPAPAAPVSSPPETEKPVTQDAASYAAKRQSVVVAFGPYKGKTAPELSDGELGETIEMANEKLMEQPKARWAKAMRENLSMLEQEVAFRDAVPPLTGNADGREPGSDDGDEGETSAA